MRNWVSPCCERSRDNRVTFASTDAFSITSGFPDAMAFTSASPEKLVGGGVGTKILYYL
jgi:hypothetical protein